MWNEYIIILKQSNHEEILQALREKQFFDDTEQKKLGTNKIKIIMNILKNKCLHYFKTFLFSLKKLPNCIVSLSIK